MDLCWPGTGVIVPKQSGEEAPGPVLAAKGAESLQPQEDPTQGPGRAGLRPQASTALHHSNGATAVPRPGGGLAGNSAATYL